MASKIILVRLGVAWSSFIVKTKEKGKQKTQHHY